MSDEPTNISEILPAWMVATEADLNSKRNYKPERYELGYQTAGLAPCVDEAHKAVQWWLNDILHGQKNRARWITLHGTTGSGKTHLVRAAIATLRAHGKSAQRWPWGELRDMLLGDNPGLWHQVATMPHLALDDIFTGYMESDKAAALNASLLYDLLEARLGMWTLITSNLSPADMPDMRIASRLFRGLNEVINMQGATDYGVALFQRREKARKGVQA